MAENADFSSLLEEIKENMPELYQEMEAYAQRTGKSLAELSKDEAFVSRYSARYSERKDAVTALDNAVDEEIAGAGSEEDGAVADDDVAASGSEEAAASSETLAAVSDPFRWEEFYAPVPEVEAARFDKAYDLLNGEEGKAYRESPAWQGSAFEFDNSENKSLEETLNLSACRRLASSNEDITLENLSSARAEESARIKVEYYNSLYALSVGDKYNSIKAETHLSRIFKIDEAVRAGKSEKEIFKMLSINPSEATQKMALASTTQANIRPISDFMEKRSKFSRGMHNFGKVMDRIQKFEQKNPLFGLAVNYVAAGNPIYMGYRSVLSARALYNDFQGFKDYAAFREVYKNDVAELGLKRWKEQNPESKVDANGYNQVKAYDTYEAYCEKHKVEENRVSEEEFRQLKKFQKKAAFTREEFESLRQAAGMPYEEYAKKAGDRAVSKEMFDNLVKYTDIRRTQNYAEYAKKAGARAVSEAEYNRVRALNRALNKVSVGQALKDKTTRKAMMAHSVIFVRSLPVVGQGYALGMAVKNMVSKSYWQGVKAKAQGTGHAVKTLWSKKGRDKEAWKELYSNAGGLVAEAAGAWMLAGGVSSVAAGYDGTGTTIDYAPGENARTTADNTQTLADVQTAAPVTESPSLWTRFQGFMGYGSQEVQADAAVADSTVLNAAARADSLQTELQADTLQNVQHPDALRVKEAPVLNFQQDWARPDFVNAADSADVQVPYAPGEHESDVRNDGDQVLVEPRETAVKLNDVQKTNLNALFEQYPRAASIILEGNDNPAVDDVTKGTFTMEGEGDLYKSGVISSAQLKEMMAEGKFTPAQLESLSRFADANFENGKMNAELSEQLYGSDGEVKEEVQTRNTGGDGENKEDGQKEKQHTDEENNGGGQERGSDIRFYSFDKDGNIIYSAESLQDLNGLNPDQMDARAYQDLLTRQANGEQLDAGALKFLESYKESHPDLQQRTENGNEGKRTENGNEGENTETVLNDREQTEQLSGIALTRHDFESGKGYEMLGSGEISGKKVDVFFGYDENDMQVVAQYAIHDGEDRSTVIKTQLGDDGRPYTLVTEIDGDKTTTREVDNAQEVLRKVLAGNEKQTGRETEGLEESRNLTNEGESGEEKEVQTHTDKVRSSTFRGRYWLEADANGENPQLRFRMGDPSQIAVDRELVAAFQNTVDGSGSSYTALGGRLTADNFGAENRDNPNASGIMVKCENLARTIALNEAVYQDMEHRLANGEELSELDMKWRQKYEHDLEGIGLSRENGRLVYEPEHVSSQTTDLRQEEVNRDNQGGSRRVYQLNENGNDGQNGGENTEIGQTEKQERERENESVNTDGLLHASEVNGYTQLEGKGIKIAYTLTDDGGVRYANNATVAVDKNVLQAIRSQYDNPTPKESGESLNMARDITKGEVIYDYLQQESGNRELTDAENSFMQKHNQTLERVGLVRDNGGEIVKKDAYEGQPRAFVKRGREYGC